MTVALNCRLGVVSQGLEALANLPGLTSFIQQQFLAGSHGNIALSCSDPTTLPNAASVDSSVTALQLHNYLLQMNQNPPNAPLTNICVLFASTYDALPGAFGIMFDRGFTTDDDPNSADIYLARPRQGCAVFLKAIQTNRTADQYLDESQFTTVHELGHVFNLQHDETCLNFMRTSASSAFGPPAFLFTPFEQSRLEVCSSDPTVMPGSSTFGADGAYNADASAMSLGRSKTLDLKIDVARKSFCRFEPIHLDLQLSLRAESAEAMVSVPEILDAGDNRFRVMIENDVGERYLYRPPHRTCGPPGNLEITEGSPYRRDLPLFGQAGGYTFRRAGRHRIWAELELPNARLRSNVLKVYIEREVGLNATERETRALLSTPRIGRLLFHREDSDDQIGIRRLGRYIDQIPDTPSAAEINYCLARAVLKQRLTKPGDIERQQDSARRFLERALSLRNLGTHRRLRAESFLAKVQGAAPGTRTQVGGA